MNKKKEKLLAVAAILIVFALMCLSCAVPIPLMLPIAMHDCDESCAPIPLVPAPVYL